jgi:putative heme-binding domain-containing protein
LHPQDNYLNAAIISSLQADNLPAVLGVVVDSIRKGKPLPLLLGPLVQTAVGLGNPSLLEGLVDQVSQSDKGRFAPWQMTTLAALLDAWQRHKVDTGKLLPPEVRQQLAQLQQQARSAATSDQANPEERLASLSLLGRDPTRLAEDITILVALLGPSNFSALQSAAVTEMGRLDIKRLSAPLIAAWATFTPQVRSQVVDLLLSRETGIDALLTALESKTLPANQLDAIRRERLLNHRRVEVRDRARKLLTAASNSTRQQVLAKYQEALRLTGEAGRGKMVFAQRCSACHQLEGVGHKVGADLAGSRDKSPLALLTAILDPNQAVEARYNSYVVVTKDGRSYTGVLAAETTTTITIVGPEGKEQVLLRRDLEELQNTGKSFMPEGLEQEIDFQGMADLLTYLAAATTPKEKP